MARRKATRRTPDVSAPLERASKVLALVAKAPEGLRAVEIAERVELAQPTAYRLVQRLEKIGYLQCDEKTLTYTIGPALRQLARTIETSQPLKLVIDLAIQNLADDTGMTAYIATRIGTRLTLVLARPPKSAAGPSIIPGYHFPAHATAAGRALLAFQPAAAIDTFLKEATFERITPATITSPKKLLVELEKVRQQGFAIMRGELGNGMWAMAVPVPAERAPVFAVGVVTFESQVENSSKSIQKLAEAIRRLATDLSHVLADHPPPSN
ncbi:IclR family transcriptional regulator [Rhodoligotrophos defluvii]|uniref:IclR family transcriptional regulator n=1 Tax=Rhodoligotrophos defluvii TaxID=2561934 RepID=UPI0010C99716|nr:IclR family transcriptional regulator [Rhodoligotrophos defluvii]